jgi:hypothetical protein
MLKNKGADTENGYSGSEGVDRDVRFRGESYIKFYDKVRQAHTSMSPKRRRGTTDISNYRFQSYQKKHR